MKKIASQQHVLYHVVMFSLMLMPYIYLNTRYIFSLIYWMLSPTRILYYHLYDCYFLCRLDPGMFRVVLGEHDRSTSSGREVIKTISRIIVVSNDKCNRKTPCMHRFAMKNLAIRADVICRLKFYCISHLSCSCSKLVPQKNLRFGSLNFVKCM